MRCSLMAVLITLLVAGPQHADDETEKDKRLLQGTWKYVSYELNGDQAFEADVIKKKRMAFKGDKVDIYDNLPGHHVGSYRLNAAAKPKEIDMVFEIDGKTSTTKAIYALEGDTLKLCGSTTGKRPRDFATKKDDPDLLALVVLERVKE